MKKLLLILLCLPMMTLAQQEKGTYYLSLNNSYKTPSFSENNEFSNSGISFGNETFIDFTIDGDTDLNGNEYWNDNEKRESTNFNIGCEFGYFVFNQTLIGVSIDYNYFSSLDKEKFLIDNDNKEDNYLFEEKGSSFSFSPFARYYFKTKSPLFISSKYVMGKSKYDWNREIEYTESGLEDVDYDDNQEIFTNRFVIGIGISIALSEKIVLEPSLNNSFNTYKWSEEEELINQDGVIYMDDREHSWKSRSYYLNIAASYYF